jgi:hypothetical protein
MKDLDSADWLCFFTLSLIRKINPNIATHISKKTDSEGNTIKRNIFIKNISEEDITKLEFLTNTDDNNNFLYLESFGVRLANEFGRVGEYIKIPGQIDVIKDIWRQSDSDAFLNNQKTHKPLENINKFVDSYTDLHKSLPKTYGFVKMYDLGLNPDCNTQGLCTEWTTPCHCYECDAGSIVPDGSSTCQPNT